MLLEVGIRDGSGVSSGPFRSRHNPLGRGKPLV
ncbi:hypothetical protein JMJ77_0000649, partial [Colletotrichum scovillei]